MKILISYDRPLSHILNIQLHIDDLSQEVTYLHLPAWRPGRYEMQNYAQNMYKVRAYSKVNLKPLQIQKTTRNTWRLHNNNASDVIIKYPYYAHQMDAGGSWLDEQQVYINFINCILYMEERQEEDIHISFDFPSDYQVATGLISLGKKEYLAKSFHQLVDSPIMASPTMKRLTYAIDDTQFNIWLQGSGDLNEERIVADFKSFSQVQMDMFGGFPTLSYHFLIQLVNYPKYHGVEHHNSTVITLGPDVNLKTDKAYIDLLGISSHELFHVWNVKRIRPIELTPYHYGRESYFETGYIAEGVTTYYGDLMLVRSGVLSVDQYLQEINQYLERHFMNPGRHRFSLAESSRDLWVDGYRMTAPGRKVSIYIKGALVALILDLKLRELCQDRVSLDDVLIKLWEKWNETDEGYTTDDYRDIVQGLIDTDWSWYFDDLINGVVPLESYLETCFKYIGCELVQEPHKSVIRNRLGLLVDKGFKVLYIAEASPCTDILSLGDQITNINDVSVSEFDSHTELTEEVTIRIDRYGREMTLIIPLERSINFLPKYLIKRNVRASTKQLRQFMNFIQA